MLTDGKEIMITMANIDFRRMLLKTRGAERLMSCYQCGTCTADCPIAKRVEDFRPRNIARLAIYGQKDRLLGGDTIWLCAGCYTCYERCPERVRVSEIIMALRELALKEGLLHATYRSLMNGIAKRGYIYEIGEFENEMREEDGLPQAPEPPIDEIRAIMKRTGFERLLGD